jgi:predicted aldo/keto reductase-like oxidoreductase
MLKDTDLARKLINDILDQGVNCIDTARVYNSEPGSVPMIESEVLLGEEISARTDIAEPLLIVTKGHGYTPEAFLRFLDESTLRLRIAIRDGKRYIGNVEIKLCYLLHGINADRWAAISSSNTLEYAKRLQSEGRFDFFGFSSHQNDGATIKTAIDTGMFDACELPYNVYSTGLGEGGAIDLIKLAHERGMGVINMKAYNGSGSLDIIKRLGSITGIGHVEMTRFCLSNPCVSTIDAGVRSIAEYLENADASAMPPLSAAERKSMLDRANLVSPHFKKICRECMHCVELFECPNGVNFPAMLGVHGRYEVSKTLGFDTSPFRNEYIAAANKKSCAINGCDPNNLSDEKNINDSSNISDVISGAKPAAEAGVENACVRCGKCLEWCEYHLNIPDMLAAAAEDFA